MPRYLDPKSDLVFKKIFGHHPNVLQDFLNAILPLPPDCVIESLIYLPSESVPEITALKYSIVDVRCFDNHGRHFIVEMQLQWTSDFIKRMLFNTATTYARQLKKGKGYEHLSPVYGVALLDTTFSQEQEWFHHYRMTNAHDESKSLEDIQLVLIELPKFKPTSITTKRATVLWLRFLKEINEKTEVVDPSFLEVDSIKEAISLLEIASYSEAELLAYDKSWDAVSSERTLFSGKYKEGLAQGLAQGEAKGLAQGEAKGKEEEKKRFVISMHRSGLPLEQIAQIAELSQNQVHCIIELLP
ncbi:MAG: Rpn family recombination-promoting nuclease/putative transposase [Verrucomicrobiae bacterium]|jgi:predicted transposase/invertase (TIGR01784 family)|nr:Rpn family recombination-promoting nuclease/putative transposase [Verrucomicrobiae bacterium]